VDAAAGGEAVELAETERVAPCVAAAGDEEEMGGRAPAGAGDDPRVGGPVAGTEAVVVAVMGGGPLVDSAVGADSELDALPVVVVVPPGAGDRHAPQGGRIGVVGPKLEVDI